MSGMFLEGMGNTGSHRSEKVIVLSLTHPMYLTLQKTPPSQHNPEHKMHKMDNHYSRILEHVKDTSRELVDGIFSALEKIFERVKNHPRIVSGRDGGVYYDQYLADVSVKH